MLEVKNTYRIVAIYTLISLCFLYFGLSYDSPTPGVRGISNLYALEERSITGTIGLHHRPEAGDSLTLVRPSENKGIRNIRIDGEVEKESLYDKTVWTVSNQVICKRCEYNNIVKNGEIVYVIYPNIYSARYVSELKRSIPENYKKGNIDLSLDVSGNQKEDILVIRFCRNKPTVHPDSTSPGNCEAARKAFRFVNGEYVTTYESPTPPRLDH